MLALLLLGACATSDLVVRNNEPVATFLSPRDGDALVEGHPATLLGTVADTNDPAGSLVVHWLSGDTTLCENAPVASDGTTRCEVVAAPEDTALTLQVFDPDGAEGVATVNVDVLGNEAPVVTLDTPDGPGPYPADTYIVVEAIVSDAEEPPADLALAWTDATGAALGLDTVVDSDGGLSGALLLGPGTHFLTLTATDRVGATGTATTTVTVAGE